MPRNGKQKDRLTKREVRKLRKIIMNSYAEPACADEIDVPEYVECDNFHSDELYVSRKEHVIHMRVYNRFHPNVKYIDLGSRRIAFLNKEDRSHYEEWYDEYIKKYTADTEHLAYPPPTDGMYPYIENSYDHSGKKHSYQSELENWIWILENSVGAVRYAGNMFFFSKKEDAAMFRLSRLA